MIFPLPLFSPLSNFSEIFWLWKPILARGFLYWLQNLTYRYKSLPCFYSPLLGQKGACLFHTFGYDLHCHPHSLENPAVLLPASQRDSNRKGYFIFLFLFFFSIVTLTMCQHRQQWLSVCFCIYTWTEPVWIWDSETSTELQTQLVFYVSSAIPGCPPDQKKN